MAKNKYLYDKQDKGENPHRYFMYTVKDRTSAKFDFHLTVPISDVVAGSVGSYPHVTITGYRGRKKWMYYAEGSAKHLYVVWVQPAGSSGGQEAGKYMAQDKDKKAISLNASELILFNNCVSDMELIGCLPWKKDWDEKWNGQKDK